MRAGDGCPGGPGPRGDQSPLPAPPGSALPAPLPPDTQQTPEAGRLRLGASQAGTAAGAAVPTEERALPPPLAPGCGEPTPDAALLRLNSSHPGLNPGCSQSVSNPGACKCWNLGFRMGAVKGWSSCPAQIKIGVHLEYSTYTLPVPSPSHTHSCLSPGYARHSEFSGFERYSICGILIGIMPDDACTL
ncbi:PREDICTED: uncharacterized protein LOC105529987 [Mandrillus leucophaeus]|uniref:uncharacterized protein LOC105529987 n=1 Tax=Mandrillus leucophaeus TaxID=9568 RepID=UPI0005F3B8A0|nr:PREDICTED: uncharacterized protein LOC105529987 [Mandrillus leucophaeus]